MTLMTLEDVLGLKPGDRFWMGSHGGGVDRVQTEGISCQETAILVYFKTPHPSRFVVGLIETTIRVTHGGHCYSGDGLSLGRLRSS